MKTQKLLTHLAAFLIIALLSAGCDDRMKTVPEVAVTGLELDETLANGITLEKGATKDISWKVTLSPRNATDRAESYSTSDPEIATVSPKGLLGANTPGNCNVTISVGGKSVEFPLTVVDKILIPATSIYFSVPSVSLALNGSYDLSTVIVTDPVDANEDFDYTSSQPSIVSVSEHGLLLALQTGESSITVAAKRDNSVSATITVKVTTFTGDYPRTGWLMTASHDLFKSTADTEKNSLQAALDGDLTTNFCLVRPGKGFGNTPRVDVPSGAAIYFTCDMLEQREVNYFRIRHRDITQVFIRWFAFDRIEGSNDGVTFTQIAQNVTVTNASTVTEQESPDIAIPSSNYRYLRFYAQTAACFYQNSHTSQGSSVQIQELYIGFKP